MHITLRVSKGWTNSFSSDMLLITPLLLKENVMRRNRNEDRILHRQFFEIIRVILHYVIFKSLL